jgi:TRAP-type C4-dicarboxylate transport system permease small subunit
VARLNVLAAVTIFAALTAVVALQVLNRLVLHLPLIWSEEMARFLFFWVALLGAAISVHKRRHFVLDVAMGRRPRGRLTRAALTLLPNVCVLAFSLFLFVVSVGYTGTGWYRTATNSGINMGFVYAAIPVFALLSAVYAAANARADVRGLAREAAQGGRGSASAGE